VSWLCITAVIFWVFVFHLPTCAHFLLLWLISELLEDSKLRDFIDGHNLF